MRSVCWQMRAAVTLCLVLVAGCWSSSPSGTAPGISSSATTTSSAGNGDKRPTVAFISNNVDPFWTIARKGAEKAAKEFDVNLEFKMPANGSAAEQRQIIEDLLSTKVDGIAISPNDAANQAPFLDEVAAQVPLLTQDSDLPKGSKRLCYIGTNNYEAGRAAGELVKKALPDGGRVVILVGKMDAQNAIERRQGVLDVLADQKDAKGPKLGKYELMDTMTDDKDESKCKDNAAAAIVKYGSGKDKLCLVGLWAYNPPSILAAVKDANAVGKIPIVAFDEHVNTLQGIRDGAIVATVVQQPYQFGYEAVKLMASIARGDRKGIPANGILYQPHKVIDKSNVDPFEAELKKLKA